MRPQPEQRDGRVRRSRGPGGSAGAGERRRSAQSRSRAAQGLYGRTFRTKSIEWRDRTTGTQPAAGQRMLAEVIPLGGGSADHDRRGSHRRRRRVGRDGRTAGRSSLLGCRRRGGGCARALIAFIGLLERKHEIASERACVRRSCGHGSNIGRARGRCARAAVKQGPIHVTSFFEVNPGGVNQAVGDAEAYRDAAKARAGRDERAGLSGSRRAVPAREPVGVAATMPPMKPT